MRQEIYWIESDRLRGRLAIMARPRAGDWLDDEVAAWAAAGIQHVVSLLESSESRELGIEREEVLCRAAGLAFASFPIADRGVPESRKATFDLVVQLEAALRQRENVAIHCRAGIGRSSLIAACVLASAGHDPSEAFTMIAAARHLPVPDTEEQRAWVIDAMRDRPSP